DRRARAADGSARRGQSRDDRGVTRIERVASCRRPAASLRSTRHRAAPTRKGANTMRITRRRLTCSSSSPDRARLPRAGSSRSSDAIARRRGTLHAIVSLAVLAWAAAPASASAQEPADTTDGAALVEGLLWQRGTNGASVPWDAAHEYCETLEHAGFDDWRLPTLAELETLHDPSRDSGIRAPLELDDCCVWSATNLVD